MSNRRRKYDLDDIVAAALDNTHELGLAQVTMRSIGERLGAAPMSLYRYVADRDQLIDLTVDRAFAELELPPTPAPDGVGAWLATTLDLARRRMLQYPGIAEHLLLHGPTGPHTLAFMADVCATIRRTGRDAARTAWAYDWLMTTAAAYVSKQTMTLAGERREHIVDELGERARTYLAQRTDLAEVISCYTSNMESAYRRATGAVITAIVTDIDQPEPTPSGVDAGR